MQKTFLKISPRFTVKIISKSTWESHFSFLGLFESDDTHEIIKKSGCWLWVLAYELWKISIKKIYQVTIL